MSTHRTQTEEREADRYLVLYVIVGYVLRLLLPPSSRGRWLVWPQIGGLRGGKVLGYPGRWCSRRLPHLPVWLAPAVQKCNFAKQRRVQLRAHHSSARPRPPFISLPTSLLLPHSLLLRLHSSRSSQNLTLLTPVTPSVPASHSTKPSPSLSSSCYPAFVSIITTITPDRVVPPSNREPPALYHTHLGRTRSIQAVCSCARSQTYQSSPTVASKQGWFFRHRRPHLF